MCYEYASSCWMSCAHEIRFRQASRARRALQSVMPSRAVSGPMRAYYHKLGFVESAPGSWQTSAPTADHCGHGRECLSSCIHKHRRSRPSRQRAEATLNDAAIAAIVAHMSLSASDDTLTMASLAISQPAALPDSSCMISEAADRFMLGLSPPVDYKEAWASYMEERLAVKRITDLTPCDSTMSMST